MLLDQFDEVRIINLASRADRRREMRAQLVRAGAADDPRISFFTARRPPDAGEFPSVGARGCFESHHAVIREALTRDVHRLLILEDDLDFVRDPSRGGPLETASLKTTKWDVFYGTPELEPDVRNALRTRPDGLASVGPHDSVLTASCVGFGRAALERLEPFLTAMAGRPGGSPDYGPMHVDGAYTIFRRQHPEFETLVCWPPIGKQRSSRSNIADNDMILDRFGVTRPLANTLRRLMDRLRR